ncbi:MAG: hypothetical protein ACT4P2_00825 [Pseudomonadota bacterium]
MVDRRAIAVALSLLVATGPWLAAAQTGPEQVPHVDERGQRYFEERFPLAGFHRAFAVSGSGKWAAWLGASSLEDAKQRALANCQKDSPAPCALYAVNGYVVWGKNPDDIPLRSPSAPNVGRFIASDYYPVRGPQAAKGVVIWSHGYRSGVDATKTQPHGYVSRFHAAGWDIYRYNREWVNQIHIDIQGMVDSVAAAKAVGYAKVILAGQSQGAWTSLEALARGADADGVIATAPARHGAPPSSAARSDFRQLLRAIRSRNAANIPLVITLFQNDDFEPGGRFADVAELLVGSTIPSYFIDRPADLPGHGAGANLRFNDRFGPCIFRFVTQAPPTPGDCR